MGEWTIIVKDTEVNDFSGKFVDWRLNLWGEAIDGTHQLLHPLPEEHDDDHPYEDAHVATTTVEPAPVKTEPPASSQDDYHDRPVNQKPPEPTSTQPAATEGEVEDEKLPINNTIPTTNGTTNGTTTASDSYLSPYLPTFGASKRTQVWIYASLTMIIVFFIGLGIYFQLQRLKRRRTNPQDDYEFEMVEDEDELHPMTGGGGRTQRRGGELYNAFAGESDEEVFSDDDEPYRDRLANSPENEGGPDTADGRLFSEK